MIMQTHKRWWAPVMGMSMLQLGCQLGDVKLGDQAELGASSGSEAGPSDAGPSEDGIGDSGGSAPATGVGKPCDHNYSPGVEPQTRMLTSPAPACPDLVCLYADDAEPPAGPCDDNDQCNAADPSKEQFLCDLPANRCMLSSDYFLERSMCSAACDSDLDCIADGESNCESGFVCVVQSSLGNFCCQPVCACADDVDFAVANALATECESGTAGSCCSDHPDQGLCP